MRKSPIKWWRSRGVQTLKARTKAAKIGQALAKVDGLMEKRVTKSRFGSRTPKAKRATKRALEVKKSQRSVKKRNPKGNSGVVETKS